MNGIEAMVRQMQNLPTTRAAMVQRVADLRQTMTQRQVALELGISRSTVFNMLREFQERGQS